MPELVGGDAQRVPVVAAQRCGAGCVVESVAEPVGAEASATLDEQEVRCPALARVGQGSLRAAQGHPLVECVEGGGVEGDGAFGAEFAEWHLQPATVAGRVPDAVQLEVEQFAEADAGAAQQGQSDAGERVVELVDCGHQVPVDIGWQCSRQRFVEAGDVAGEQQPTWWAFGPAPERDVIEEAAQVDDSAFADRRGHGLVAGDATAPGRPWL